jgi:hypothetical protein
MSAQAAPHVIAMSTFVHAAPHDMSTFAHAAPHVMSGGGHIVGWQLPPSPPDEDELLHAAAWTKSAAKSARRTRVMDTPRR